MYSFYLVSNSFKRVVKRCQTVFTLANILAQTYLCSLLILSTSFLQPCSIFFTVSLQFYLIFVRPDQSCFLASFASSFFSKFSVILPTNFLVSRTIICIFFSIISSISLVWSSAGCSFSLEFLWERLLQFFMCKQDSVCSSSDFILSVRQAIYCSIMSIWWLVEFLACLEE